MSIQSSSHQHDPDSIQLVDLTEVRNWLTFAVHSMRRRWRLGVVVLIVGLGLTVAAWLILPRTYRVDVQLLAKRNSLMPALGNPGRKVPLDADSPTLGASEAVLRRDNLLAVMKQTDLMRRWDADRSRALKLKDRVMNLIDPTSEDDRINGMIGLLEKRISVFTGDATVTISVEWTEAQLAYQLADAAMQNFLEQRRAVEVSTIEDTITILQGHATSLREAIDAAIEDLKRSPATPAPRTTEGMVPAAAPPPRRDPAQEALRAEAAEARLTLEAKRRSIKELEESRRRRHLELQNELAQQRSVYADAHPNVVRVEQQIAALEEDSPQLSSLRQEESDLVAQTTRLSGMREGLPRISRAAPPDPGTGRRTEGEDLRREYARTSLRFAMEKYDSLQDRIDSAKIELDTAQAAFKYRYNVIRPPVLPKRPVKPQVPVVFGGGALASVILAILAAIFADLRSGRVLESWQAEKLFGLSLLGTIPRPAK